MNSVQQQQQQQQVQQITIPSQIPQAPMQAPINQLSASQRGAYGQTRVPEEG
jgi:hypothetical protein